MASIGDTTRPAFAYDEATDTWVPVGVGPHSHTPAAIGAISNSLTTTTGDLIYAASANTPARLGIGSTGNVLTVSGGVPVWSAPAGGGKVLQVVYGSTTTQVTSTSNTFVDTTLSATITPTSSTSKILVLANMAGCYKEGASAQLSIKLLRDSTSILTFARDLSYTGAAGENITSQSTSYLDSPATTSATTYKTQFNSSLNASQTRVQVAFGSGNTSTIILMEIGA